VPFLFSCEKPEGKGGSSTIKGKIYAREYNSNYTLLTAEYFAEEEDVYIIYGDDDIYSDDFKTHYDGSYEFTYLRKGKYTIFAYSDDSTFTSASGKVVKSVEVEITENDQVVEADVINIIK
jgi:hypothetical protein